MKPVADTHHLQKRGDTWHFYRRVPTSLVPVLGRKFVKRSLGVTTLAEAKKLRAVEEVRTNALFDAAEKGLTGHGAGTATQPVSMAMLTEHVRKTVDQIDKRSAQQLATDPADVDQLAEMRLETGLIIRTLQDPGNPERHERVDRIGASILKEAGAELSDNDQAAQFADIVRRGLIEISRRRLDRYEDRFDHVFFDAMFDPARTTAVPFGELCDVFIVEKETDHKANGVSPKRTDKVKAACATLREIVGEATAVHEIDDDVIQNIRSVIAVTPNNRTKIYPKLTLAEAIERARKDGKPTLSPSTQSVYLDVFRDVMKVAVRKKHLPSNPAVDLKPLVKGVLSNAEKRRPLTTEQLKGFFTGAFYKSCAPDAANPYSKPDRAWRFWLPLISLFSGARPNEICSLTVNDIGQTEAGTWFFAVTDQGEDGKTLKTEASRRRVPIHPELIKLGLLKFVEQRRKDAKNTRLFSELKANKYNNRAVYALKRFNETFIPAEISLGERQSFYSLRHCVRDALRRIKATPETLLHVTGWSPAGKAVSDIYGDASHPDHHAEAVAGIAYDLDLEFLYLK